MNINRTRKLTHLAMLLALTVVLSIFEGMIPNVVPVPGVKIGLANIAVMYSLLFYGKKEAVLLNVAKAALGFAARGAISGFLSLCGGLLSIAVIVVISSVFKKKISYILLSVAGAVFHNIGQLIAVYFIMDNYDLFYYLPILIISGVIMGIITGILLNTLMPVLSFYPKKGK